MTPLISLAAFSILALAAILLYVPERPEAEPVRVRRDR
jgi:hypothetical protein